MTGYEKSRDYGGPPVRWWTIPLWIGIMVVVSGGYVWLTWYPA